MRTSSRSVAQVMHHWSFDSYIPARPLVLLPRVGFLLPRPAGVLPSGRLSFWLALAAPCRVALPAIWHNCS